MIGVKPVRYIILALLMSVAGALVWYGWNWGTANLYFKKADYYLKHWQETAVVEADLYPDAMSAIDKAIDLHPNHAHYLNVRAKIYQWGAFAEIGNAREQLLLAQTDFLAATELRPTWPVTWIDLAQIELDLNNGQANDNFFNYLDRANQSGPYIEEVLAIENAILNRTWPQLSFALRQHYYTKLKVMSRKWTLINSAFQSAERYNRLSVMCSFVRVSAELESIRKSTLYRDYCS